MVIESFHLTNNCIYLDGSIVVSRYNTGSDNIPGPKFRAKRTFKMSRLKVRSACAALWISKKSKNCLFLTFTFAYQVTEDKAAEIWELFLNNLRNNYKVENYVWVKELQTKQTNRIHYHIIIDRNRINIKSCQKTFNTVVTNCDPNGRVSNNSVRLGSDPVIRSYQSISKYISKAAL